MRYLGRNYIYNFTNYYCEHYFFQQGETVLLIPKNSEDHILIGISRVHFLTFMSIPFNVADYEIFEADLQIDYTIDNETVIIANDKKVKQYLLSFLLLVTDLMKSAGTESLYIRQQDRMLLEQAKADNNCIVDGKNHLFQEQTYTMRLTIGEKNDYAIKFNGNIVYKTKNGKCANIVWKVLINALNLLKANITNVCN